LKPELVCKIEVQKTDGKTCVGSGYPIARNRIITAAHVIADAIPITDSPKTAATYQITLSFGARAKVVAGPVSIEWNGTDSGVDVAVMGCELPDELQPTHVLLTSPPPIPIEWFAHGYTEFRSCKIITWSTSGLLKDTRLNRIVPVREDPMPAYAEMGNFVF
jgi:hypothetical protein